MTTKRISYNFLDYLPVKYQKEDLKACNINTLHEILGFLLIAENNVDKLQYQIMTAKSRVYEALACQGAKTFDKLPIYLPMYKEEKGGRNGYH